jgi:DNA-binding response OmpR family regulator
MSPKTDPLRVLYVEDNADTREMVTLVLGSSGHRVTAVESYADALLAAKRAEFDLYIIDNRLPDGLGIELCGEIRAFDQVTPIVFCSGFTDDSHRRTALNMGAQTFLPKPFDSDALLAAIANATN